MATSRKTLKSKTKPNVAKKTVTKKSGAKTTSSKISKTKNSKKHLVPFAVAIFLLIAGIVIYLMLPHFDIEINGVTNLKKTSANGLTIIEADIDEPCEMEKKDGIFICRDFTITGKYAGNRDVVVSLREKENVLSVDAEKKITLSGNHINIKEVAIRDVKIKSPVEEQYTLQMKEEKTGKVVVEYRLNVRSVIDGGDLAKINTLAPDVNLIKSSLEKIDTVPEVCIVNEDNDPNGKIGKDGSYYIKLVFWDNRLQKTTYFMDTKTRQTRAPYDVCEMGASVGGTVEIYKDSSGATARKSELDAMLGGFFDSGPSMIIGQTAVIRVSSD